VRMSSEIPRGSVSATDAKVAPIRVRVAVVIGFLSVDSVIVVGRGGFCNPPRGIMRSQYRRQRCAAPLPSRSYQRQWQHRSGFWHLPRERTRGRCA
jgi:hypothetical protein